MEEAQLPEDSQKIESPDNYENNDEYNEEENDETSTENTVTLYLPDLNDNSSLQDIEGLFDMYKQNGESFAEDKNLSSNYIIDETDYVILFLILHHLKY